MLHQEGDGEAGQGSAQRGGLAVTGSGQLILRTEWGMVGSGAEEGTGYSQGKGRF